MFTAHHIVEMKFFVNFNFEIAITIEMKLKFQKLEVSQQSYVTLTL